MKVIHLMRHAKSSWDDAALDDFDRPLNARGRKAARGMARRLAGLGIRPQVVLCSGARRARQTFEALDEALEGADVVIERGLYEAGPNELLARLWRLDDKGLDSVLLIGHNPAVERLALALASSGADDALARLEAKFPTAALATLTAPVDQWTAVEPGTCRLERFVRPADLE